MVVVPQELCVSIARRYVHDRSLLGLSFMEMWAATILDITIIMCTYLYVHLQNKCVYMYMYIHIHLHIQE